MKKPSILFGILISFLFCIPAKSQFAYPTVRKVPFDTILFHQNISDEYYWMSRKENEAEMLEFSKKQGKLTQQVLDSVTGTEILGQQLYEVFGEI
ncbi:MAG: hypothetical protein LC128_02600 [Chitinophagales bacterium]|nr:hypothetical protein [Chitinophagales bacterium]